jgi:hypothetical protein
VASLAAIQARGEGADHRALTRLATEMANGDWIIPSDDGRPNHPEVAAFVRALALF